MSNVSNESLVRVIDKILGTSSEPIQETRYFRNTVVGASFGAAVVFAAITLPAYQLWILGGAAVVGGAASLHVSRQLMLARTAADELTTFEQYLVVIQYKQKVDSKGLPFLMTFRTVLEKNGMTPKRAMDIVDDIVKGRESTTNAYYITKAILDQLDGVRQPT